MQSETQLLRGITSTHLYRGRKRLTLLTGYGLYASNDRMMGVRVGGVLRKLLLLPHAIRISALVGVVAVLFGFLQNQPQPYGFQLQLWLLLLTLAVVVDSVPRSLLEKSVKSLSQPRPDWITPGKDFEVSRDKVSGIEFRWPGDLRVGHIMITTQSGPIKIWFAQPRHAGLASEVREFLVNFCRQNPRIDFVEKA